MCGLALVAGPLAWSGAAYASAGAQRPAPGDYPLYLQAATTTPTPPPAPTAVATAMPAATIVPPLVFTTTTNPNDETVFTLQRFGLSERVMHGPFDWAGLSFTLPAHWELIEGSQIELDLVTTFSGPTSPAGRPAYVGTLDIAFDGQLLATVALDTAGESTVVVPLPVAVSPARIGAQQPAADGRRLLSLTLNAAYECDPGVDAHTTLAMRATSRLVLPHRLISPPTDLRRLPYPIVQRSLMPDVAVMVVPDSPTPGELQAAMTVAAGLGHMSGGQLALSLATDSRVTPEQLGAAHLILVGQAGNLPLLTDMALPAPRLEEVTTAPTDGVLQMVVSPWNVDRVALVVSGSTDAGVLAAGQAFSARSILVDTRPDLSVVSHVEPRQVIPATTPIDRSLADMGYSVYVMSSAGVNVIEVPFDVQPGQASTAGAYFDLVYNHSGFLNFGESGVGVSVNDQPVGGIALTPESATGQTRRIVIPPSALREGRNALRVEAYLVPASVCAPLNVNTMWFAIQPDSRLHLPFGLTPTEPLPVFDLGKYPYPFLESPVLLEDTAMVVAGDDPAGWDAAARLAFDLGQSGNREMAAPSLYFADNVPADVRHSRHLVVIGQPARLPLLAEMTDALPASIEPETNLPVPQNDRRVDYVLRPGASLGFLQIFASPWNPRRAILAVLGSTETGYGWAVAALTTGALKGQLSGNLALVSDNQVVASYLGLPPSSEPPAAPNEAAEMIVTPQPGGLPLPLAPVAGRPAWILPAVFLVSGLMIIVLLIAAIVGLRRRSTPGT